MQCLYEDGDGVFETLAKGITWWTIPSVHNLFMYAWPSVHGLLSDDINISSAIIVGDMEYVRKQLMGSGAAKSEQFDRALSVAALYGKIDIVSEVINYTIEYDRPLTLAVTCGHVEIVKLLIGRVSIKGLAAALLYSIVSDEVESASLIIPLLHEQCLTVVLPYAIECSNFAIINLLRNAESEIYECTSSQSPEEVKNTVRNVRDDIRRIRSCVLLTGPAEP